MCIKIVNQGGPDQFQSEPLQPGSEMRDEWVAVSLGRPDTDMKSSAYELVDSKACESLISLLTVTHTPRRMKNAMQMQPADFSPPSFNQDDFEQDHDARGRQAVRYMSDIDLLRDATGSLKGSGTSAAASFSMNAAKLRLVGCGRRRTVEGTVLREAASSDDASRVP